MAIRYMRKAGDPKKNLQYSVELTSGEDKGLKQYIWSNEFEIEEARLKIFLCGPNYSRFNTDCPFILDKKGSKAGYDKNKDDSLLITAENEEYANCIAEALGLSLPFEKIRFGGEERYSLNKFGKGL